MSDSSFSLLCGIVVGVASLRLLRIVFSIKNVYWLCENYIVDRASRNVDAVLPAIVSSVRQRAARGKWRPDLLDRAYINTFGRREGIEYPKTFRFMCVSMSHLRHAGLISPEVAASMSFLACARIAELDPEVALSKVGGNGSVPSYPPEINSYSYAVLCTDIFEQTRQAGEPDPWLNLSDIRGKEAAHQRRVIEYVARYRLPPALRPEPDGSSPDQGHACD